MRSNVEVIYWNVEVALEMTSYMHSDWSMAIFEVLDRVAALRLSVLFVAYSPPIIRYHSSLCTALRVIKSDFSRVAS